MKQFDSELVRFSRRLACGSERIRFDYITMSIQNLDDLFSSFIKSPKASSAPGSTFAHIAYDMNENHMFRLAREKKGCAISHDFAWTELESTWLGSRVILSIPLRGSGELVAEEKNGEKKGCRNIQIALDGCYSSRCLSINSRSASFWFSRAARSDIRSKKPVYYFNAWNIQDVNE